MSFTVYASIETGAGYSLNSEQIHNLHNLPLVEKLLGIEPQKISIFEGVQCSELIPKFHSALIELSSQRGMDLVKELDAGSYYQEATRQLSDILYLCRQHPKAELHFL